MGKNMSEIMTHLFCCFGSLMESERSSHHLSELTGGDTIADDNQEIAEIVWTEQSDWLNDGKAIDQFTNDRTPAEMMRVTIEDSHNTSTNGYNLKQLLDSNDIIG